MPLYLLCSEEGEIIDVVHAEDCEEAQALVNTISILCIEIDNTTLQQIKIAKGDAVISEISADLARIMNDLIDEYKTIKEICEPLDGDEVEKLGKILSLFAQCHEGNITDEEYRKAMSEL